MEGEDGELLEEGELSDVEEFGVDNAKLASKKRKSSQPHEAAEPEDINSFILKKKQELADRVKSQFRIAGVETKVELGSETEPDAVQPDPPIKSLGSNSEDRKERTCSNSKSSSKKSQHRGPQYYDLDRKTALPMDDPTETMLANWAKGPKKNSDTTNHKTSGSRHSSDSTPRCNDSIEDENFDPYADYYGVSSPTNNSTEQQLNNTAGSSSQDFNYRTAPVAGASDQDYRMPDVDYRKRPPTRNSYYSDSGDVHVYSDAEGHNNEFGDIDERQGGAAGAKRDKPGRPRRRKRSGSRVSPSDHPSISGSESDAEGKAGRTRRIRGSRTGPPSKRRRRSLSRTRRPRRERDRELKGSSFRDRDHRPPCKFYREGFCREGDQCSYSHDIEQMRIDKKPDVCKYFMSGYCRNVTRCPFMHGEFPCKFFHKGDCQKGGDCRFSHEPLNNITRPIFERMLRDDEFNGRGGPPALLGPGPGSEPLSKRKVLLGSPPRHLREAQMQGGPPQMPEFLGPPSLMELSVGAPQGPGGYLGGPMPMGGPGPYGPGPGAMMGPPEQMYQPMMGMPPQSMPPHMYQGPRHPMGPNDGPYYQQQGPMGGFMPPGQHHGPLLPEYQGRTMSSPHVCSSSSTSGRSSPEESKSGAVGIDALPPTQRALLQRIQAKQKDANHASSSQISPGRGGDKDDAQVGARNDEKTDEPVQFDITAMLRQIRQNVKGPEEDFDSPASPPREDAAHVGETRLIPTMPKPRRSRMQWHLWPVDVLPPKGGPVPVAMLQASLTDTKLRGDPRIDKHLSSQFDAVSNMFTNQIGKTGAAEDPRSNRDAKEALTTPRNNAAATQGGNRDPRLQQRSGGATTGQPADQMAPPVAVMTQPPMAGANMAYGSPPGMPGMMPAQMGPNMGSPMSLGPMAPPMAVGGPAPNYMSPPNYGPSMYAPIGPPMGPGPGPMPMSMHGGMQGPGWMPQVNNMAAMGPSMDVGPQYNGPPPSSMGWDGGSPPFSGGNKQPIDPRRGQARSKAFKVEAGSPGAHDSAAMSPGRDMQQEREPNNIGNIPVSLREKRKDLKYDSPLASPSRDSDESRSSYNRMPHVRIKKKTSAEYTE